MQVQLIIVPYDVERTDTPVAGGPCELLELGFAERLQDEGYDVRRTDVWHRGPEAREVTVRNVARATARAVALAQSRGRFPLVLAGGCLAAVGVTDGLQRVNHDLQVLWVDAHGDFNTPETTGSGYWDGMALAAVCGRSLAQVFEPIDPRTVPHSNVIHVAGRDLDPPEVEDFARLRITLIPPQEVGTQKAEARLRKHLDPGRSLYVHLDLDGLDPSEAPAVNLPVADGIRLDGLLALLRAAGPPAALTVAGFSVEKADEAARAKTFDTVLAVVRDALAGARATIQATAS